MNDDRLVNKKFTNLTTQLHTLKMSGGSLRMTTERRKTKAGADENRAVTSVGDVLTSAREYM